MSAHILPLALITLALGGGDAPRPARDAVGDEPWQSYLAHIAAADSAIRLDEPARAMRWLESAPAALRGWEWRYLSSIADQSLVTFRVGGAGLFGLALSPDGRMLAAGGNDRTIRLFDAVTRREIRTISGHEGPVHWLTFSPDGKRLASSSEDRTARLWEVATGRELAVFREHKYPVGGVAFSPDGSKLASSAYHIVTQQPLDIEGRVFVWALSEAGEPTVLATLAGGRKPLVAVQFSPDASRVAAASWDFAVYVWPIKDRATPVECKMPESPLYNAVDAVSFSPDGRLVAGASKDRTARVWRADSGELVTTLEGHGGPVMSVAFSHDGQRIATGCGDDLIRLWDAASGARQAVLRGHRAGVRCLIWGRDDTRMLTASVDGFAAEWDTRPSLYDAMRLEHKPACYATVFSPDGRRLYTCAYDGTMASWDIRGGQRLAHWTAHADGASCHALGVTADGRTVLSGSHDKHVRLWDPETQKEKAALQHDGSITHAAISPDGRFAAATQGKSIWLWTLGAKNEHVATLDGHTAGVSELAFSHDGRRLASTSHDKTIRLWDVSKASCESVIDGHTAAVRCSAFSPDDRFIATGSGDGTIRTWSTQSGAAVRTLLAGDDTPNRLSWSPDGRRIAAGGDGIVILSADQPGEILRMRPHPDTVWHLSFSPDGTQLASCSWDGSIAITDVRPVRERATRPRAVAASAEAPGTP